MANTLQKLIYSLSSASPILIIFAFIWFFQKGDWTIPIICIIMACIFIAFMLLSFSYGKKHLSPIQIHANEISPNDKWILAYIITYIAPLSSIVVDSINVTLCSLTAVAITFFIAYTNTTVPNPILLLQKYHFYSVSAETGVSGYILISKRALRKKQDLHNVNRLFEFLLLDMEE